MQFSSHPALFALPLLLTIFSSIPATAAPFPAQQSARMDGAQLAAVVPVFVDTDLPIFIRKPPVVPPSPYGSMQGADLGPGASLKGAIPFPANNPWNTDISAAPLDPNSDALIASIGLNTGLHPDFGSGLYQGAYIGIPYVVVAGSQPKVPMVFGIYDDGSPPMTMKATPDRTRCRRMRRSKATSPTAQVSAGTAMYW
jgi:hypothetical protein